ncbi:MAG: hypothetical protein ACPGVG_05385 [Mycobacterium sp.]
MRTAPLPTVVHTTDPRRGVPVLEPSPDPVINWVRKERFEAISGYSLCAIDSKIKAGVWAEGKVWKKAPDGRILISITGYHRWVEDQG